MSDKDYVNQHRLMLQQMALGAFSGSVEHNTRVELERIAHNIDWKLIVTWSCGSCVQTMARIILNNYPE